MMATKKPAAKKAPAKNRVKPGTGKEAAAVRKKMFAEAYIANGGNATAAAKAAGYSEATAYSQGHRLLKDVEVSRIVESGQQRIAAKFELTTDAVLRNLAQAIFFDPRKLYREDGTLKDVSELDDDTAMALSGLEVTEEFGDAGADEHLEAQPHGGGLKRNSRRTVVGYTKKLKWLDKNAARDQAMKHLGMFREDNAQRNPLAGLPRETVKSLVERLRGSV